MKKRTVRLIEELRKISDSEWEEVRVKLLESTINHESKRKVANFNEEAVYELMKEVGVPSHLKGCKYLRRAIILTLDNPKVLESVTKTLYPTIAKEFDATCSKVERSMGHAIERVCDNGNMEKVYEIFRETYSARTGKPTNAEFIAGMADYIRYK